jgi:hypothetical protein
MANRMQVRGVQRFYRLSRQAQYYLCCLPCMLDATSHISAHRVALEYTVSRYWQPHLHHQMPHHVQQVVGTMMLVRHHHQMLWLLPNELMYLVFSFLPLDTTRCSNNDGVCDLG